jgi:hypothetical protein
MDGKQRWNTVYRSVRKVARNWAEQAPRCGGPDTYSVAEIALVWLWLAFHNWPRSGGVLRLKSRREYRWWRSGGWHLLSPDRVPHETTVKRRADRADCRAFLAAVDDDLLKKLKPQTQSCLLDSTPLPVGNHSHDADARWGHHRLRGYRWHTITSADRIVLASIVAPANVHELTVAPTLVEQLARRGVGVQWLPADEGYDSEPLHEVVVTQLGARLVAPLNDRGGHRTMLRTPHRARLNRDWNRPVLRRVYRQRGEIDRMYSTFKCSRYGLWALPPWIRHLPTVARWVHLKQLLYHAELVNQKQQRIAA